MSVADWLSLSLIFILGASSPGPSLIVILASTRSNGRKAGIMASIGHGLGIFIYAFSVAASLSLVLTHYQSIFIQLQLAGAVLLIWMGTRLLLTSLSKAKGGAIEKSTAPLKRSFRDGFAIAIFNPKIAAFFASLFSQFLEAGQSGALHFAMAGLASVIDMSIYILLVIIASMKASLSLLERYGHVLDLILSAILIALGLSLLARNLFW